MRLSAGVTIKNIALRSLYEAMIGRGPAAQSLTGLIDFELESGWSDTECHETLGSIESKGSGVISSAVMRALAKMAPPAKRPPDIALAFVGNYSYEKMRIDIVRDDTDLHDVVAVLDLKIPRPPAKETPKHAYPNTITPHIEDFHLEAPLLSLLDGLPVEIKSDLSRSRRR